MKSLAPTPRTLSRLSLALSPLVLMAALCNVAHAREGNVFSLTVSEALQYDDNLFRVNPHTDNRAILGSDRRDDFISVTSLALDASKQVGRHNFYGTLNESYFLYQEFRKLNYTRDNARVGWSGVYGAANSWDSYYSHTATQSDFADTRTSQGNKLATDTLGAETTVRIAKDWVFRPAVSEDRFSNSLASLKNSDGRSDNLSFNLGLRPYSGNVLEGQYRHTERHYDNGNSGGVRQNEMGVLGIWQATAATAIDLRVALLQQNAKNGSSNGNGNYHQVIGYANYRWKSSGASTLNLRGYREVSTVNTGVDQDRVARGATATWSWTPLAKTTFDTAYDYRKQTYKFDGSRDNTQTVSVAAAYVPVPSVTLRASIKNERRRADPSSRDYEDHVYMLSAAYKF